MTKLNVRIGEIPTLILFKDGIKKAAANGTIIFYHGFASTKEAGNKELESLMNEGYLVIAVDNVGHGERRYIDFDNRFSNEIVKFDDMFTEAVLETAQEVSLIIDYVVLDLAPKAKKFAVSGISMGGYIAFRAILCDYRISVAIPILGSPKWKTDISPSFAVFSPHKFPEMFYPCKILSLNGGADKSVPPEDTRNFHKKLEKIYRSRKMEESKNPVELEQLVQYIEIEDAPHFMSEEDWNFLWSKATDWLKTNLKDNCQL